jgi:heterodisulfide reductase subunit C
MFNKKESSYNWDFFNRIVEDVDENRNIIQCISCGKCVGDCPASKISDFNIRRIIERVLTGDESILEEEEIWYCFLCNKCSKICPKDGINIPLFILSLRNEAFKSGYRIKQLKKYVKMCKNFLENGTVMKESDLTDERINELKEICKFARIKYLHKASEKNIGIEE